MLYGMYFFLFFKLYIHIILESIYSVMADICGHASAVLSPVTEGKH